MSAQPATLLTQPAPPSVQVTTSPQAEGVPPEVALLQMVAGYWVSQSLYVAAKLGIADLLKDGPRSADELAAATGAHADSLYRLLRALAGVGVFAEGEGRRFRQTPLSAPLQSGPNSARALTIHTCERASWHAWGDLLHSITTGETAFAHTHGQEVFPYYAEHPESAEPFNQAMTEYSAVVAEAVNRAYDFSEFEKIVDIGGGHGQLLASVLKQNPRARGVVFDQPEVAEGAQAALAAEGLSERCEAAGGDFFEAVPAGGDAYLLKSIIHDWDDERSVRILRNINRAMKDGGRLLLVETYIPEGDGPAFSKLSDLHMMVMTGGRERTAFEFAKLFRRSGFRLTRIIPTDTLVYIIEAEKDEHGA